MEYVRDKQQTQQASPVIKVYLTDDQFKELVPSLLDRLSSDLVNELIDERIEKEQAPYLKQKDFAKWIGESVATVNELKAQGLPVSYALGTARYGKQSYIDFMKSKEKQNMPGGF
ncbi:hypothetical protein DB321_07745 [Ligilactobacillus salivarius]|uniref:Uncharacterized protein n=2 Tax=Ligilactobacillus salivarius TaxID=1624 RepID=C2EI01_9LACO|nr:hypothetical protein [Ligilactobacillus salivarius]ATP37565.1 hypothetical protein CR531_05170 [Ligilactobacillus salivarius]EEJ73854.1 hypothetical protein HMPREF0545_1273 [Ligilactobacillus salivarius DSM 20555 = ATCC 11741]KRM68781.1 hypothetical protein FC55_GL000624 [Ligilactobacillus salivarius DSM 20555 = ATCC 11741]MBE7937915.1 hypothetical protein [Ligilactobacillus salivarius]MDG9756370.1 hypothetical protein [Ligilactobacillus salivarius]